jgi:hypothetical protein
MSNHHGNSGPNQDGGKDQKRKVSGDLHVRGEIVVDSPPEVKDAAATEKKESSTRENLKVRIEVFTLFFVIIYAGLTFWQACSNQTIAKLTRKQFLADERPYVATTPTKNQFRFRCRWEIGYRGVVLELWKISRAAPERNRTDFLERWLLRAEQ